MLVEGLYLYMLVVKTFSGDNIRFNIYVSIGWGEWGLPGISSSLLYHCLLAGGPALFVVTWALAKGLTVGYNSNHLEKVSVGRMR